MELDYKKQSLDTLTKQRNMFLGLLILSLIIGILLCLKLMLTSEKTILVPGLNQEVWIKNGEVSSSYLEETAVQYLPFLIDLDKTSIDWKRTRMMNYVSRSDESYLKDLNDYYSRVKDQYKQFDLSTHFALKQLITDSKNLQVIAIGQLVSRFGERGFESKPASYRISFDWVYGKLLIKEFVRITKEEIENE